MISTETSRLMIQPNRAANASPMRIETTIMIFHTRSNTSRNSGGACSGAGIQLVMRNGMARLPRFQAVRSRSASNLTVPQWQLPL